MGLAAFLIESAIHVSLGWKRAGRNYRGNFVFYYKTRNDMHAREITLDGQVI